MRHIHYLLLALVFIHLSRPAEAQTGWVYLRAHPPGVTPGRLIAVTHTFLQVPGGPTEVFTSEFAPGSYTFSKVISLFGNCYASATSVGFTIVANQWDTVDVVEAWDSCFYQATPATGDGGAGTITTSTSDPQIPPIDCSLIRLGDSWYFGKYSTCQSSAPFGMPLFVRQHPAPGSYVFGGLPNEDDTTTATVDTTAQLAFDLHQLFVGPDGDDTAATSQIADLSVTRTGGSAQGMVMVGVYKAVNLGPGHALDVQLGWDSFSNTHFFGGGYLVSVEPSLGNCSPVHCSVADLPPGDSVIFTLRLTAIPIGGTPVATPYCDFFPVVATLSADPDLNNNSAPCTGNNVQVTVTAGGNPPPSVTVAKGTAAVPMLQFVLTPATAFTLDQITLSAAGTGNEVVDITAVNLYRDSNGNGQVDAGEPLLSSGTYGGNNGLATLHINPPYGISVPTTFLVTYDFNLSLASRLPGVVLFAGVIPIGFLARRKRRRWAVSLLLVMVVFGLSRCGGDSSGPGGGDPTYKATLTGLTASGVPVAGVSVPGATVTVAR